jgi:hypothetical protein
MKPTVPQVLATAVSVMVVAAVVTGFLVAGSPALERARRMDEQRVAALSQIADAVGMYVDAHEKVPATLEELEGAAVQGLGVWLPKLTDPTTNERYRYEATGDLTYRLCATFEADPRQPDRNQINQDYKLGGHPDFTERTRGESCWDVNLKERAEAAAKLRVKANGTVIPPGTVAPEPVR